MIKMRPSQTLYTAARTQTPTPSRGFTWWLRGAADIVRDVSSLSILIVAGTWIVQQLDEGERRRSQIAELREAETYIEQIGPETPPELANVMFQELVHSFDELRGLEVREVSATDFTADRIALHGSDFTNVAVEGRIRQFILSNSSTRDGRFYLHNVECGVVANSVVDTQVLMANSQLFPRNPLRASEPHFDVDVHGRAPSEIFPFLGCREEHDVFRIWQSQISGGAALITSAGGMVLVERSRLSRLRIEGAEYVVIRDSDLRHGTLSLEQFERDAILEALRRGSTLRFNNGQTLNLSSNCFGQDSAIMTASGALAGVHLAEFSMDTVCAHFDRIAENPSCTVATVFDFEFATRHTPTRTDFPMCPADQRD